MSFLKIILNDSITNTPKKLCQKVTGHKIYSGDYNSQYGFYTPDEHSNRRYVKGDQRKNLQTMLNLQDKYGGDIYKNDKDESFYLKNKNGTFFNNGRALNAKTGKMTNYNMSTGRFIVPTKTNVTVQNNTGSTSQPTRTAQARRSIQSTKPMQTVRPKGITHTATYTPGQDAKGAYAVKGWTTNQWGGGKRGILDADVAKKLGLKEGATAQDAQNFLKSKGYGITSDNYWGKQSQAAFNDFINRGSVKAAAVETPQLDTKTERHNYATWDPKTKQYDNYNPNFEITPQQLRDAGVTNFRTYQNFMGNPANASNQYKGVYDFFNRVKEQNSGTNFGDETAFNKFFGTSGNFGRRDRNRIISAGATSQAVYDRVSPQGTPITTRSEYGSQYDALNKTLTDDDRKVGNIIWVNSGDTKIPVYQAANGNYYKLGDNNTLIQTGTYTMDPDGKYSVTFRNGGILNKFQQGGQINMNEQQLQQAFLQYLMQKTGAQDEQQLEQVVQQLGEDGLEQAYAQFIQEMQQQQVQAAKFGAKLNYIKKLNGQCPDGYELQYYKSGGQLCKKCIKNQVMQDGEYLPQDPIDQFKCGRKIKKKKCEAGGTVDMDKCGAKMKKKKCEDGGIVNIDKCGAKIKKKKCENGGFIPFDKCGNTLKKKISKKQNGGYISNGDEYSVYKEFSKLSPIDQFKRRLNIAKQIISDSPSLPNLYNAAKSLLGGNDPENPYLIKGEPPSFGGPIKKATSALEALEMVKAMKAQKAAKTAKAISKMTSKQRKAYELSKVVLPKDIQSSGLTKSGKQNIQSILDKLPESERGPILQELLQNKEFWRVYGNGLVNVTPSRAAGTINGIRRRLGFQNGLTYGKQVQYGKQMSGFKEANTVDATRRTTGFKRTTSLKQE